MDSSKCELPLVRVSLCGVTSLCDVLPQLSLPSPLPTTADKSLLFRWDSKSPVCPVRWWLHPKVLPSPSHMCILPTQPPSHIPPCTRSCISNPPPSSTAADKAQMVGKHFSDLLLQSVTEAIDSVSTQHMWVLTIWSCVHSLCCYCYLSPHLVNNPHCDVRSQRSQKLFRHSLIAENRNIKSPKARVYFVCRNVS